MSKLAAFFIATIESSPSSTFRANLEAKLISGDCFFGKGYYWIMQEPITMFLSQRPDLLQLLRTIAHIIAVDYNVLCRDPLLGGQVYI